MSKSDLRRSGTLFKRGKRSLMRSLARNTLTLFQSNFTAQAFRDIPRKKWKRLKKPRKDGSTRPILVDTGNLLASGKTVVNSPYRAKIMFKAKYASYHNKGTGRLPKRQFSGDSKIVDRSNEKIIVNYIKKVLG